MSYRIVYGKKRRPLRQLKKGEKVLLIAIAVCVVFVVIGCLSGAEFLLPGDPEVSSKALESMANAIRDGETITDAITVFCQEIIANAQMLN